MNRILDRVVIVGAGPAAHRLARRLRQHEYRGLVTLLGAERRPAYNRMLLPSVLSGALPPEVVTLPELDAGTTVRLGVVATAIDRRRHLVYADDGSAYPYDVLVLATGARPTPPGSATLAGVPTLRTLEDCARVTGKRIVVLGGGILRVQAALALHGSGRAVTVVHRNEVPLNRLVDQRGGRLLAARLADVGLSVHLGRTAVGWRRGHSVQLDDGGTLAAETVIACTGVVPNVELARACGLTVGAGVVVDHGLRTSDPDIYAIGDCAEQDGDQAGAMTRAWDHADALAAALTGGQPGHRHATRITRLAMAGIDLAVIGRVADLSTTDSAVEQVTLTDQRRARYVTLALRDRRIVGAVLIGLPDAIATIGQLHDRNDPVPTDRLGLLLGRSTGPAGPVELPGDAMVCLCNNVTKNELADAFHAGAATPAELALATRATTGCGTCTSLVGELCATFGAVRAAAA